MQRGKKFLSDLKLYSDYLKWNGEKYENWEEACLDIINGHKEKYGSEIQEYLDSAYDSMTKQMILASQRSLQYRRKQIKKHNARIFNCTSTHLMRNRAFQEIFYLALCGCGVGVGLLLPFVSNLSKIKKRLDGTKTYVVADSIEGWADALGVLMSSYFEDKQPFPEYANFEIKFDFSQIREKGSYIDGGFKAPGPDGLKQSLEKIEQLLEKWLEKEGNTIRPILAFDIICHSSDAVLSGGVRRSALNMIVDPNDKEMINAKTGNWNNDNPQRGRSNNSVLLLRKLINKEEFENIVNINDGFNDIGFVFANSWFDMFNPCFEILKLPVLYDGDLSKIHYDDIQHFVANNEEKFGVQGCVDYDTKLITKNGIEIIGDLAENRLEAEIWNGKSWSTVRPIKTNKNVKLYRISFNDGSYLDVTNYHKFLAKDRFQKDFKEYTTQELMNYKGKYKLHVPDSKIKYENDSNNIEYAYEYGYILGDGCATEDRVPFADLYYDMTLPLRGKLGKERINEYGTNHRFITFFDVDKTFSHQLKYSDGLPKEIFGWSRKSILDFFAGWIDSDGSKTTNGVRIYGREDKMRDGQLLLTKMGINSSVNLMSKKGFETNYAIRKNDVWYLQISQTNEMYSNRIKLKNKAATEKCRNKVIKNIVELEGLHDSYCFEEPEEHQGVFNNILTKQCNLSEINAEKCTNETLFLKACKDAAILGTLQAGYTIFPYLGETSEKIFKKEALLGVSITGWMNNPILFNAELLRKGAEVVKETNKELSTIIGINQAARTTCVKPSGNASVVLGTASGIHPEHSERYFRIMQLNKESNTAKWLDENMDFLLEESVWSSTKSDFVVFVPIQNPKNGLYKKDMKGIKHLELIKLVQENWVNTGTNRELCSYPEVNHNVSCTVIIDNKEEIFNYIWENKESFTAVSFLSDYGDKDFNQAPFTSVLDLDEIVANYGKGAIFASGLIIDGLHYFDNNLWSACDSLLNKDAVISGTREQVLLRKYWVSRAKKFAKNFFKNDIKKMVYCLKDIHLFHKWEIVNREFRDVDFSEILDKPEYKDISDFASMACAGGSCEITQI